MTKTALGILSAVGILCLLAGCSTLSVLDRLEQGDFYVREVEHGLNSPDWLDDATFFATFGPSNEFAKITAPFARILKTYKINDSQVRRLFSINLSPDGTLATFGVQYNEPGIVDIYVYDLARKEVTNLTNGTGQFHGSSFLSDSEVVYAEFDSSVAGEISNRLIRHNINTSAVRTIVDNTFSTENGEIVSGVTFWSPKVSPGIEKIFAGSSRFPAGDTSFKVLDLNTGAEVFDGFSVGSYERIGGGDWIDENTVVMAAHSERDVSYIIVDLTNGSTQVFPLQDQRVTRILGVNVSPNKVFVGSVAAEWTESGHFVANYLLMAKIGETEETGD